MQGKIHVFIGASTLTLLCVKYPTGFDAFGTHILPEIGLLTAAVGSYAPDIDLGRSHSGMKHQVASKVVSKVGGGHRGITHTLLVPFIVAVLMFTVSNYIGNNLIGGLLNSLLFGWEFGYVMHLLADMFNGKGIPIFWPLLKGKVHIMDIPSNGFGAWAFSFICVGFIYFLVFKGVFM